MKSYNQLTFANMVEIETLLNENYKANQIAIKLGREKSTIYRCINGNLDEDGEFKAEIAWKKILEKRHKSVRNPRVISEGVLEKYILEKIETYWSPEQIAGTWKKKTGEPLSSDTVYQYIYKNKPKLVKMYFRRKGKKYQKNRASKYQIQDRKFIEERPKDVESRKELGHWEGDTIIGKEHKGAIVTNVERKSGFLLAAKVKKRTAYAIVNSTGKLFKNIPEEFKLTMTYDNGREFAYHRMIEYLTKLTVYFARPYSPWQRGSNENTNGLLRQFLPKGSDFTKITEKELLHYVNLLNDRPRKRLNWMTPREIFRKELQKVALDSRI